MPEGERNNQVEMILKDRVAEHIHETLNMKQDKYKEIHYGTAK